MNPRPPPLLPLPRAQRSGTVAATLLVLLVLAVTQWRALAAVPPSAPVLVVNSDASVAKYQEVQNAFKATFGTDGVTELDLAKVGEAGVRRAVAANPGVIHCIGANAYLATAKHAKAKPIILSTAINWERFKPLPASTRVIANELPAGQQLTLFRHFFPKLQRVGVIYNPAINKQWFAQAVVAGKEVGIEVIGRPVNRSPGVGPALAELTPKVDVLWLTPDPVVLENEAVVGRYFTGADAAKKPVFAYSAAFMDLGATLVLAPDMPTVGRQAAAIAQDFAGAPAVSAPAGSEVTLNLKRVQQYGLELNREALDAVSNLIR
ncbi:MAG: hypothetical protein RL514_1293 [Verrucomicrobiota bacterium]|jgi:putative ABC transport system substrate-binding protein